ncbi:hypothetical protein SODALDRAFT_318752 [Sodiomyces alkalinus F11]|uniref:Uncharacterized protein n=1 Tax=Sodiomyces alkalinus (strain CBS 110278 / VKM F-3762 / F11) TaxID=1314773 RepID=A0A3N2Q5B6_SODAK|nr:hypothetical protein SODALDRAFT_318752 [Sodiomyces alkalinus F11]ROT41969.1 hypothetical protein SODALDRAFT_318752 [Sodiomyces alkalinus F11]
MRKLAAEKAKGKNAAARAKKALEGCKRAKLREKQTGKILQKRADMDAKDLYGNHILFGQKGPRGVTSGNPDDPGGPGLAAHNLVVATFMLLAVLVLLCFGLYLQRTFCKRRKSRVRQGADVRKQHGELPRDAETYNDGLELGLPHEAEYKNDPISEKMESGVTFGGREYETVTGVTGFNTSPSWTWTTPTVGPITS